MKRFIGILTLAGLAILCPAQQLEFEYMTWPEVHRAIHQEGKTTVLIFSGGIEQRGPANINGAHNVIAKALSREIAQKLGNAIAGPVIPFSLNSASPDLPGTIGISSATFTTLNEEVAEQLIVNGFRNVVFLGDHGGGQKELATVATKLQARHGAKGIHVVYCPDAYEKAGIEVNKWLEAHGYPVGSHASIKDTSEMLYLGESQGLVRKELLPQAFGDTNSKNGIRGDARRSTAEIGKVVSDIKVDLAVKQIRALLGDARSNGQ